MVVYKGRVFSVEVLTRRFPNGSEHEVASTCETSEKRSEPDWHHHVGSKEYL